MTAPDVKLTPRAFGFELQGALASTRNLGAISGRLPYIQERAIATLRRRLPVIARRDIQQEYAIKAGRLRQDLSFRGIKDGLRLTGHWRGIGLRNYGARDLRKSGRGVSYRVFNGQRSIRPHAFMATLLGGGVHVVHREGPKRRMKKGRYIGKMKQPLVVDYGPTAAQMLRKGRRPERLVEAARGVLAAEMKRLTEIALNANQAATAALQGVNP